MHDSSQPKIVILGAGFGGVEAARALSRLLRRDEAEIILVDQNNFLLFTPMLIEVLGGQVEMTHIVAPNRQISPRVSFLQGRVERIDPATKTIRVRLGGTGMGDPAKHVDLHADHLIVALGSIPNYYGIPGLSANSVSMKNLCDAVGIHNRCLALLERADTEPDEATRRAMLCFVIGGGGFSGVETAAALRDMLHEAKRFYPNVRDGDISIILIDGGPRLLPELGHDLGDYASKLLCRCGIDVMLNTKITKATADCVELEGGKCVDCRTLIWAGGVSPVAVVRQSAWEVGKHGGIVVEPTCAVPALPGVWALGDCAEVPTPDGGLYGPTAQNAIREGKLVARNIVAALRGEPAKPFTYKPIGEFAALGKRSGVARVYGIHISGFPAWFLWRTVYLLKLPHLSQRIRVAIDWTLDLIFGRDIIEVPTHCFVAGTCGGLEDVLAKDQDQGGGAT